MSSVANKPVRFDLSGKVALVTAAAGGFGSAITTGLAEHGAAVVATDIVKDAVVEMADKITAEGGQAAGMICDVTDETQVTEVVKATLDRFGRLDILVNIAGVGVLKPILEMSRQEYDQTMDTCLRGAFICSQIVGRAMRTQGQGGSVIHISSIAGARALGRGTGIYAAAKAGLNAMVRELAVEWAGHGIRVNAIAPCQFLTPPLKRMLEDERFGEKNSLSAKMLARIPIGRFGLPEDLVGPCVLLASDAAAMMTGQVVYVDGGYLAQ
ncbi:MAG: SDR family oxidoreductase [Sedimentisphaerales bacterium]|nr:SDR family oxidoreductase [Sedimentisphaerales bacterium]